jgi:hypothetical protein
MWLSDFSELVLATGPDAKAGWASLRGHYNYTANRVIFVTLRIFCGTALVQNQIFALCRKSTTDGGCFA